MEDEKYDILQYIPNKSFVHPTFWHKLAEIKIDVDRLCDLPKHIFGYYTNYNAEDCLLEVDYSSFNSEFNPPKFNFTAHGILYNKNTIEEFKDCEKSILLGLEGNNLLEDIKTGRVLDDPGLLFRFVILSFADLRVYKYYYWFAFPAPTEPTAKLVKGSPPKLLKDLTEYYDQVENLYNSLSDDKAKSFFVLSSKNGTFTHHTLKDVINVDKLDENLIGFDPSKLYFCFSDTSKYTNPSWALRIFIVLLHQLCPTLRGKMIHAIGIRVQSPNNLSNSLVWDILIPQELPENPIKFVGWEPNVNGKMGPRCAAMGDSMDPAKLAENSMNLNLKLMKWRLMPDLDLDKIAETKCLLFGAGTLGCAVARNLLAWGFKTITFLDNGKVSYSNPVRQTLYRHEDAVNGRKLKAATAAERVKEINPNTTSQGFFIEIPMPGHTVGESMRENVLKDLNIIEEQVKNHDVIFMLTDSRESRWLPTLLGAYYKKLVINAALGFDSYLVMRHGSRKEAVHDDDMPEIDTDIRCIPGTQLGCYFCNDVTAPGNSMKDRTLDQQCTVTRPGVSNIAASYAVELLVSIIQHKHQELAPAYFSIAPKKSDITIPEGILGIIPHSIRGMLGTFENILPATMKFSQCIACSENVLKEFHERKNDFLFDVFASTKYLEDLTGISKLQDCEGEILEYGDSDIEFSE